MDGRVACIQLFGEKMIKECEDCAVTTGSITVVVVVVVMIVVIVIKSRHHCTQDGDGVAGDHATLDCMLKKLQFGCLYVGQDCSV